MGIISNITDKMGKKKGEEVTEDLINKALSNVIDPDLHKDIVTLGFVRNIQIKGSDVFLDVNLTTPACPMKDLLHSQAVEELQKIPGIGKVDVKMTAVPMQAKPRGDQASSLALVKNIIAVASGKGGVGKSTATINLATALSRAGAKVGVMDADIYGPSVAHLTGVPNPSTMNGQMLVPPVKDGIKMISVSMFGEEDQAQVLRGPMAGNVIKQFMTQIEWGELDYLLIDYPPGTGDIQLTISQIAPVTGAVIVTTPQETALIDVRKSISMFNTLNVPIIGVVENMSYFVCDGCDKKHFIFKQHGGVKLADQNGVPLLGQLPLDPTVVTESESKQSVLVTKPESEVAKAFQQIVGNLVREVSVIANSKDQELTSYSIRWRT